MEEIVCLNLYYTQTAATFEYDGAVVQDLSMQLSWALAHIDALETTVMAQPLVDHCSAGLGASSDTVASAERSRNFGDCSGRSRDSEVAAAPDATVQPSPTMTVMQDAVQVNGEGEDAVMTDGPAISGDRRDMIKVISEG